MRPSPSRRWLRALVCAWCLLQLLPAQAQQRAFQYLRQEQGLENLAVTALVQDGLGDLWIGTENGLYRFDGARMHRYAEVQRLAEPSILALHVDASGLLWVGTKTMLFHRDGDGFRQVTLEGQPFTLQPGQSLASTREHLLVNTRGGGLYRLRRDRAGWQASEVFGAAERQRHAELRQVTSVLAEPGGDIWFGCGRWLCRFGAEGLRRYGEPGGALADSLSSLLRAPDGRLWLRSPDQLWQLDFGAETLRAMPLPPTGDAPPPLAPALEVDGQQRLLMQWGSGVVRWDGHRWEAVGARQGLQAAGGVSALLQAGDGSVWLGTAGAGLAHWLGYRHLQSWSQAEGLPSDDAWAFLRSSAGPLYIGTAAGLAADLGGPALARMEAGAAGAPPDFASRLAEDAHGRLWVGSFNGMLSVLDPQARRLRPVAQLPRITRLQVDLLGQLWIVTHQGIYLVPDPARDPRPRRIDEALHPPSSPTPEAHDACLLDGQVWVGTQRGLLRGDGQQLSRVRLLDAAGQPMADTDLPAIACRDGRLWVGGMAGLWRARVEPGGASVRLERVDEPLLQGRAVVALLQDRRGWLWVGTDYGVAVWNMRRWRFIRQDAGLPWNDCNQGALHEDRDGSIWVGTSRGAAHLSDLDSLFATPQLDVRIESPGHPRPDGQAGLNLPWRRRALVLGLASAAYEHRGALRFEHRMLGLDDDWRGGSETELVYPALPPGRYRFEVRARNLDLQAESPLQALDIEIQPPWWRTPWFYALSVLLALLLAWSAYRWRLRRILRRQRRLERLVAERTREIEASHAQMRELALKDGLTGVLNRRALGDALAAEVERANRTLRRLTVVLADADRFKLVNDRYGHQAGDAVLVAIAQRLQAQMRPYDVLGRYGGEEFVLVLPDLDVEHAEGRARIQALHQAISSGPVEIGADRQLSVTCSFGVASMAGPRIADAADLIGRADAALYRAKENGRDRVEYDGEAGSG